MTMRLVGAVILSTLAVLSCSPRVKPIHVKLIYASTVDDDVSPLDASCDIVIGSISDGRSNRETLGMAGSAIIGHGVVQWVREGIEVLTGPTNPPASSGDGVGSPVSIHVVVQKVYCAAQPNRLRGTVVLAVRYERDGAVLGQSSYRGQSVREKGALSSANYSFSDGAILRTLNEAMDDAVSQVRFDLQTVCISERPN